MISNPIRSAERTLIEFCTRDLTTSTGEQHKGPTASVRNSPRSLNSFASRQVGAATGRHRLTRRVEGGTDKAADGTRDEVVPQLGALALRGRKSGPERSEQHSRVKMEEGGTYGGFREEGADLEDAAKVAAVPAHVPVRPWSGVSG